jgi:acylphosphatase
MMARAHVYVGGRVQGVFFRAETANLAHHLGLQGWVRNLPDGRVEAVFEGEKVATNEVVSFCQKGPRGAHVQDFEVKWEAWKGEFRDFRVIH